MDITAIYLYELTDDNRLVPVKNIHETLNSDPDMRKGCIGKDRWGVRLVSNAPNVIRGFMWKPIPLLLALEIALFYATCKSRECGHPYEIADMELGQYNEDGYILRVAFERRH